MPAVRFSENRAEETRQCWSCRRTGLVFLVGMDRGTTRLVAFGLLLVRDAQAGGSLTKLLDARRFICVSVCELGDIMLFLRFPGEN